jgi:integrase
MKEEAGDPRLLSPTGREAAVAHRINASGGEQYKRDRLAGKWRGHGYRGAAKPIKPGTVNRELDTLRHTALSRMIAAGIDDHTVMAISGHSSTRMLERYTHPTIARKVDALETVQPDGQKRGRTAERG